VNYLANVSNRKAPEPGFSVTHGISVSLADIRFISPDLYERILAGIYFIDLHLINIYLTGIHLIGLHLIGSILQTRIS
jgi:hypothetical protein